MKNSTMLTVTSLAIILLFSIHWVDDVVHGLDTVGPQSVIVVAILLVLLCGTLVWGERRWGIGIMLLGSIMGLGVCVLHLNGKHIATVATSAGGFRFLWTLVMLGTAGALGIVLSVRGLLQSRRAKES